MGSSEAGVSGDPGTGQASADAERFARGAARQAVPPGWEACLELTFARRATGSYLARRAQRGPLTMQKTLFPEGPDVAHAILLHPPGGIAGGDELDIRIHCQAGARALLTSPGAAKWYRSAGRPASQRVELRVDAGACLEWLPQESIVFDGALAASRTRVMLEEGARFLGWDVQCLGRPAGAAPFERGLLHQHWSVEQGGRLLWWEAGRLEGGDPSLGARAGWQGHTVAGTLVAVGEAPGAALLEALRAVPVDGLAGVTLTPRGVLLVRCLTGRAETARAYLALAWALLRPAYLEREACPPRIWRT